MNALFTIQDVAQERQISLPSARVYSARQVQRKQWIRLKRNLYTTAALFGTIRTEELFTIAALVQTPSYISFATALSYYELTTQILPGTIESAATKRSAEYEAGEKIFRYMKIQNKLFNGFTRVGNFFIATPEKALLDTVYLTSLGRYQFDVSALATDRIKWDQVQRIAKRYPSKTRLLLSKLFPYAGTSRTRNLRNGGLVTAR